MDQHSIEFFHAQQAVKLYDDYLLRDPNVVGVGVGSKRVGDRDTDVPCLTIMVARKYTKAILPASAQLPAALDIGGGRSVPVDVIETGHFFQHANTARIRPARPGTSLGNIQITAGTFGALVIDNTSKQEMILSNNHVLADNNLAPIGSAIVQPGRHDGGTVPADTIATLTRFITIVPENEGNNFVDAAVALPGSPENLSNNPLNGVPAPSAQHPAVGLLWGGNGTTRSNFSPISTVLALLRVSLPAADAVIAPAPGLALQKTGRTTEATTGRIQEMNATLKVNIAGLGVAVFKDQFTTTKMSEGGDSGSVAVTKNPYS